MKMCFGYKSPYSLNTFARIPDMILRKYLGHYLEERLNQLENLLELK